MCIYAEQEKTRADKTKSPVARTNLDATNYIEEIQFRVGSLYFPTTSIRGESARLSSPEIYTQALQGFNSYKPNGSTFISESQFRLGSAVFAQTLERSSVLELSGIPLSNSRVLALQAKWGGTSSTGKSSVFYLKYVSLIRVFASNVTVEI
jgi:hypothetical protein